MNELINKLSSYDIFTNLVPGSAVLLSMDQIGLTRSSDLDVVPQVLLYYLVGMIISRFSSIVVEPVLKAIGIVKYSEYADYVFACKADPKIERIVESSNMYRSMIGASIVVCMIAIFATLPHHTAPYTNRCLWIAGSASLVTLFIISFAKQASFISQRVEIAKGK